jgi:hypothetical protein
MNYSEALSFVFRDQKWVKKIAIGGAIAFLCWYAALVFLLGFFVLGYYLSVLRNVRKGADNPLPEWNELGKLFVDGLLGGMICLVYFVIVGGVCALAIVGAVNDEYMQDFERVSLIIAISMLTLITLAFFVNYGLVQFSITENFSAAFSIGGISNLLRHHFGNFLAIIIFTLILNGMLFLAGLGILSPFTNFWGLIVQAHLFGQYAKSLQPTAAAIQSV